MTMKTVVLQEKRLVEDLEQIAEQQNTTTETLLNRAVSQFLYKSALQKMQEETSAFAKMHNQLVVDFLDHYVAIHEGKVVDHDVDLVELRRRIRQRFGRMSILLRQVTHEAGPLELVVRSPKLA